MEERNIKKRDVRAYYDAESRWRQLSEVRQWGKRIQKLLQDSLVEMESFEKHMEGYSEEDSWDVRGVEDGDVEPSIVVMQEAVLQGEALLRKHIRGNAQELGAAYGFIQGYLGRTETIVADRAKILEAFVTARTQYLRDESLAAYDSLESAFRALLGPETIREQ